MLQKTLECIGHGKHGDPYLKIAKQIKNTVARCILL